MAKNLPQKGTTGLIATAAPLIVNAAKSPAVKKAAKAVTGAVAPVLASKATAFVSDSFNGDGPAWGPRRRRRAQLGRRIDATKSLTQELLSGPGGTPSGQAAHRAWARRAAALRTRLDLAVADDKLTAHLDAVESHLEALLAEINAEVGAETDAED